MLVHLVSCIGVGILSAVIAYLIYKRAAVVLWAWIASFLPDLPVFLLTPLGATGLYNTLLITHTAGIILLPIILVIADLLLIELAFLRHLRPFYTFLPRSVKTGVRIERLVERLQKYYTIPKPERLKAVYFAGVLAGIIHLAVNVYFGIL